MDIPEGLRQPLFAPKAQRFPRHPLERGPSVRLSSGPARVSASTASWPSLLPPGGPRSVQPAKIAGDRRSLWLPLALARLGLHPRPGLQRRAASGERVPRWSPTLGGASTASASPRSWRSRESTAPGPLHSTPRGRGPPLPLPPSAPPAVVPARRQRKREAAGEPSRLSASGTSRWAVGSGDLEVEQGSDAGIWSPRPGGREGRWDPLSPPWGRGRDPSLRSVRPAEIRRGLPTGLLPSPTRPRSGETRPPPLPLTIAGETQPPGFPARPTGPSAGAGAASSSSPIRAHPAGRPWLEETLRRTGELGTGWGAYGDAVVEGHAAQLPLGAPKRKVASWNYNSHQPPPSRA